MFPSNLCLCVQAAISERLLHPENHQSADSAPPRVARLLWLPHNGWWRCVWELLCCCVMLCWHVTYLHLFCAQILFDNCAHSGKITVDVGTDVRIYECRDWNVEGTCKIYLKVLFSYPTVRGNHSNWLADMWLCFHSWQKWLPSPVIWLCGHARLLRLSHPLLAIHHQRHPASNCEWEKSFDISTTQILETMIVQSFVWSLTHSIIATYC